MRNGILVLYILYFCIIVYFCDLFHIVATWTKFLIYGTHYAFINQSICVYLCRPIYILSLVSSFS